MDIDIETIDANATNSNEIDIIESTADVHLILLYHNHSIYYYY